MNLLPRAAHSLVAHIYAEKYRRISLKEQRAGEWVCSSCAAVGIVYIHSLMIWGSPHSSGIWWPAAAALASFITLFTAHAVRAHFLRGQKEAISADEQKAQAALLRQDFSEPEYTYLIALTEALQPQASPSRLVELLDLGHQRFPHLKNFGFFSR